MAAFRETTIKRITPAAHCVCKEKKKRGGALKKNKGGKTSLNKHWDGTATARGPEMSRGPGSSTKNRTRPLRAPSHAGLSAASAAVGLPPLHPLQVVAPRRRGRELGAPLRPQGSFQLVKMPACPSCGKGSLSVAVDRDLNPGTLKLTVGGKSSRA